jgi:hypothetical protein
MSMTLISIRQTRPPTRYPNSIIYTLGHFVTLGSIRLSANYPMYIIVIYLILDLI